MPFPFVLSPPTVSKGSMGFADKNVSATRALLALSARRENPRENERGEWISIRLCATTTSEKLDRTYVFGLPALGPFGHVKLHGLAFLQASESATLNGGKMHENVFAGLAADKAVAFGVVEPLNCSLFHILVLLFLLESYV